MYAPSITEQKNVINVYRDISGHFSDTRNSVWDGVKQFLEKQDMNSSGFEIGCGNGKNMHYAEELGHSITGIDTCIQFIRECNKNRLKAHIGNAVDQTYTDNSFDYCISIAVFHHLSSNEARTKAFMNMIDIIRPGGKGLITVWAAEQDGFSNKKFKAGDNIVKWHKPYDIDNKRHYEIYDRYYYVYTEDMFKCYIKEFENIKIDIIYNQKGNWFCEFTKIK